MESLRLRRPSRRGFRTLPSSYSDSSRQQQRNIPWKVLKQICVRIKKSVVIKNLKAENPQERLLGNNTNWLHNSQIPADRGTPEEPSYGICHPNSMSMKIYVKFPSNRKTVVLEAKGYNIINDIKSMIWSKEGVQSGQYSLVCRGKLLEDYQTLASLDIRTESTLYVIFNPRDVMSIFVKIPSGKMVKFEVKVLYTVWDIKTIVESFIGCPVTDCSMIYAGNELQDCKTLDFYQVEENSTLEVLPFWFQIFINTWSGKTITLDVTRKTTVREVKDKIFCKVRVPVHVQSIVVAGKRLDDACRLSIYNIQKGSTLHMVLGW
ncbi:polyubiquitin-like [Pyrus x bretschneideri]|uniref:polyubiquitin-like n=1 Tax=Pyrus x bretschneideri TaxID=225117 RepID=UPI00202EE135|nr:polyubiquitin-like [Pyrus x bretschneideri]